MLWLIDEITSSNISFVSLLVCVLYLEQW